MPVSNRRRVLALLAALPVAACVPTEPPAPRVARFRAVRVDTRPFAAKGVSNYAAHVADRLTLAVAEAFAGAIAPGEAGAPTLVLEVSGVRLNSAPGSSYSGFGLDGGLNDDEMFGALVLLSPKGSTIDRRRHFVTTNPTSAGNWHLPDIEERRLDALCRLYAAWALREYR